MQSELLTWLETLSQREYAMLIDMVYDFDHGKTRDQLQNTSPEDFSEALLKFLDHEDIDLDIAMYKEMLQSPSEYIIDFNESDYPE